MDRPTTYIFQDSGITVRLTDLRPNRQSIQVNVYNPNDPGHSVLSLISTSSETPANLEDVRSAIAGNLLVELVTKAINHFANVANSPTENTEG